VKKVLASLAVSAVCLYLVLRGVRWDEVVANLGRVNLGLLALSMLAMLVAYACMAWRWRHLLSPLMGDQVPGLPTLFGTMMTGYFFNTFFPARAGDLMRAHLMYRRTGLSRTTILATVVIEKLFDGLALLILLVIGLPALQIGDRAEQLGVVAFLVLVGVLGGLLLFKWQADRAVALTARIVDLLPLPERIGSLAVRLVHTFSAGLRVFDKPGPLLKSAAISLLVWLVAVGMFGAALAAFGTALELPSFSALLLMTAIVNLGLLIPAMPGNIGNYEALIVAALVLVWPTTGAPIDKELAVAFALVFHVGQLLATLVVGGVAYWTQHISLREVQADASEAVAPAPATASAQLRAHVHHAPQEEVAELGIKKL
jgi:uncharacterized protein (TIRG00374 family)